ncbi:hypothetical protein ACH4OW_12640 [Streptomyces sp. NPDC017056]|uniref:hypothetical protein n=1 Tax=Streptomyces sp. NPDC017056 TaxID=3364973 RepID=UPI00379A46E2
MSIPGDQHNPYAQPQQPAPAQPPYGQGVPQQNPYAPQGAPQGPGAGGAYGYPAPGGPQQPGAVPGPGGFDGSGAGGPGGRGAGNWLWAIGGAVAASAMGGAVLFAAGAFGDARPDPDLAGYSYTSDLCNQTSFTPFESANYKIKPAGGSASGSSGTAAQNPQYSGVQQDSLDSMWCNAELKPSDASSSDYSSTWVYSTATLHKKTDPTAEFADSYRAYESQRSSIAYKVTSVPGIGDEAYLVSRTDDSSGAYVILGVRDGWATYQLTWSSYAASRSGSAKPPTTEQVSGMLKTSATETLRKLRG